MPSPSNSALPSTSYALYNTAAPAECGQWAVASVEEGMRRGDRSHCAGKKGRKSEREERKERKDRKGNTKRRKERRRHTQPTGQDSTKGILFYPSTQLLVFNSFHLANRIASTSIVAIDFEDAPSTLSTFSSTSPIDERKRSLCRVSTKTIAQNAPSLSDCVTNSPNRPARPATKVR